MSEGALNIDSSAITITEKIKDNMSILNGKLQSVAGFFQNIKNKLDGVNASMLGMGSLDEAIVGSFKIFGNELGVVEKYVMDNIEAFGGLADMSVVRTVLEQCGMTARTAGLNFAETSSAILSLDEIGKEGSEGGTVLHNVMTSLSQASFLPEGMQQELEGAGIDVSLLSDNSVSLTEKLNSLKPLINNTTLFTKLFGEENVNAAKALVGGVGDIKQFIEAVGGVNGAVNGSLLSFNGFADGISGMVSQFNEVKTFISDVKGEFDSCVGSVKDVYTSVSETYTSFKDLGKGVEHIVGLKFSDNIQTLVDKFGDARAYLSLMNEQLDAGTVCSMGFKDNIIQAALGVIRFTTVGLFQGLKALGAYILSLVTGGATSAKFAAISKGAFGSFKTSAVTACRAVGTAIKSIPIIGWVIAGITALVALGVYFWNTSAKFRAILKGIAAAFVAVFTGIKDLAKNVFSSIGDIILSVFSFDGKGIKAALNKMGDGFKGFGESIGEAFSEAYEAEMEKSRKDEEEKKKEKKGDELEGVLYDDGNGGAITDGLAKTGGAGESASKIKNMVVNIDRLVEKFEVSTTNLLEDRTRIKDMITNALVEAVKDLNYAR